MGSTITAIIFPYFLTDKDNLLDYSHMWIIEEIELFFFDVEDPARNQKLCAKMMRKSEKQGVWIAKKKRLKST